ncbi:MAG: PPOX class F420-dependent oxidoreductase [Actinobacteria bacterium]|nr:PPOX class F420-dependent oxidoreductase [Actinomycetota bacterium]
MAPIDALAAGKYLSLTTFRRDGTPVATPVWLVRDGDALRVVTQADSGKAKRLRNDSRVLLAPCDARGALKGKQVEGTASLEDAEQTARTAQLIEARYGLLGKVIMWRSRRAARKPGAAGQVGIRVSIAP